MKGEGNINRFHPLILLVSASLLFIPSFVTFWMLPDSLPVSSYKVPLLSFISALAITALGNIVIGFIHNRVNRENETALSLKEMNDIVDKIRQTHFFYDESIIGVYPNRTYAQVNRSRSRSRRHGSMSLNLTIIISEIRKKKKPYTSG